MLTRALRTHGVTEQTRLTVLSDGDTGLRAIQRAALPEADPVLVLAASVNYDLSDCCSAQTTDVAGDDVVFK